MSSSVLVINIQDERDVVLARQRALQISKLLGFERQERVRIATSVSEIARNAFQYAKEGRVEFSIAYEPRDCLKIKITDHGGGILNLDEILTGKYQSPTGMGLGIMSAHRLMDGCEIVTNGKEGTAVVLTKFLPVALSAQLRPSVSEISQELAKQPLPDSYEELKQQNQELLLALAELEKRQAQLNQLNHELEDTNRGVVALYAELDEKAEYLKRVSDVKSRFLSNMTHEFRTPLNSVLGLVRLLLSRVDGDVTPEQEKQLKYIQKSAEDLSHLVNELLDISKIEAGKITFRSSEFELEDVFSTLRGMLRPLLAHHPAVSLSIESATGVPRLKSDEMKLSQIIRNLVSNALKFSEKGEVRVAAGTEPGDWIRISVSDQGIGIAPENQQRIFEEFIQIENDIQKNFKGTGLGLPLAKKLTELLGGSITLESQLGTGSTFTVRIPRVLRVPGSVNEGSVTEEHTRLPVVVIETDKAQIERIAQWFADSPFRIVPLPSVAEANRTLEKLTPHAVVLSTSGTVEDDWEFLQTLTHKEARSSIFTIVLTPTEYHGKASLFGANAYAAPPVSIEWLMEKLSAWMHDTTRKAILIIDDDESWSYVLKERLGRMGYRVTMATSGVAGLQRAREERPSIIFLDISMPDLDGFRVLEKLRANQATKSSHVIVDTARVLTPYEQDQLRNLGALILSKNIVVSSTAAALAGLLSGL